MSILMAMTVILSVVSFKFIFSFRVHHLLKVIWKVLPVCWKLICQIIKNASSRLFAHGEEIVMIVNHFKSGLVCNNVTDKLISVLSWQVAVYVCIIYNLSILYVNEVCACLCMQILSVQVLCSRTY